MAKFGQQYANLVRLAPPRVPRRPKVITPAAMGVPAKPVKRGPTYGSGYRMGLTPPPAPLDETAGWPSALRDQYNMLANDENQAKKMATQQTAPWLSGALGNLNTAQSNLQGQYQDWLKGVSDIGNVAGSVQAPNVPGTADSGGTAGWATTNYRTGPAQQAARTWGSTAEAIGRNQALTSSLGLNNMSQSILGDFAGRIAGLTQTYSQRRMDFRTKVTDFLEKKREFDVTRHDKLRQQEFDNKVAAKLAGVKEAAANKVKGTPPNADGSPPEAPPGYIYVQNATGGYDLKPDKAYVPPAGASGSKAPKNDPTTLTTEGWKGPYAQKPVNIAPTTSLTQGTDGKWYIKPKAGGATPTGPKPLTPAAISTWTTKAHTLLAGKRTVDKTTKKVSVSGQASRYDVFKQMLTGNVPPETAYKIIRDSGVAPYGTGGKWGGGAMSADDIYFALKEVGYDPKKAWNIAVKLAGRQPVAGPMVPGSGLTTPGQ